jgi:hypothetical protein
LRKYIDAGTLNPIHLRRLGRRAQESTMADEIEQDRSTAGR